MEPVRRGEQGQGRGLVVAVDLRRLHGAEIYDLLARPNLSIACSGLVTALSGRHQAKSF
jgi:hypothetical protein